MSIAAFSSSSSHSAPASTTSTAAAVSTSTTASATSRATAISSGSAGTPTTSTALTTSSARVAVAAAVVKPSLAETAALQNQMAELSLSSASSFNSAAAAAASAAQPQASNSSSSAGVFICMFQEASTSARASAARAAATPAAALSERSLEASDRVSLLKEKQPHPSAAGESSASASAKNSKSKAPEKEQHKQQQLELKGMDLMIATRIEEPFLTLDLSTLSKRIISLTKEMQNYTDKFLEQTLWKTKQQLLAMQSAFKAKKQDALPEPLKTDVRNAEAALAKVEEKLKNKLMQITEKLQQYYKDNGWSKEEATLLVNASMDFQLYRHNLLTFSIHESQVQKMYDSLMQIVANFRATFFSGKAGWQSLIFDQLCQHIGIEDGRFKEQLLRYVVRPLQDNYNELEVRARKPHSLYSAIWAPTAIVAENLMSFSKGIAQQLQSIEVKNGVIIITSGVTAPQKSEFPQQKQLVKTPKFKILLSELRILMGLSPLNNNVLEAKSLRIAGLQRNIQPHYDWTPSQASPDNQELMAVKFLSLPALDVAYLPIKAQLKAYCQAHKNKFQFETDCLSQAHQITIEKSDQQGFFQVTCQLHIAIQEKGTSKHLARLPVTIEFQVKIASGETRIAIKRDLFRFQWEAGIKDEQKKTILLALYSELPVEVRNPS